MGALATDKNELIYIYSSNSALGKQLYGYVESIDLSLNSIDISKEKVGDTVLVEVAELLGVQFKDLLSTDHPDAPEEFREANFSTDGWLATLGKNDSLLQNPIAINGKRAKIIKSRADIMEFYGVDSAGLEQNPTEGAPDMTSTTEGETFVPKKY